MLTLEEVLPHFDGKKSLLAQRLGISRQAVSRWAMNDAIPEKHELKLRHEILGQAGQDVKVDKSQPRAKIEVDSSRKLDNVLYEIRGPVLEEAYRLEEEGHRVTKLNIGNPGAFDFHAPEEIIQDVIYNIATAEGYCESRGLFTARKAVMQQCQLNGIPDVSINDIYMGNGVSELILMSLQALLNNDDEVLVPTPDYPLWTASVRLSGGKAVHYRCDEAADWEPDIKDIEAQITDRTRAIVVINPNNPTGAVYNRSTLEKIAAIAARHNLIVFADEIYDKIVYDDFEHIPFGAITEDCLVITFGGLSKNYRLAGFRSGWLIVSGAKHRAKEYMEGINMLASMRLCSNVPGQLAVQTALGGYQSINNLVLPGGRLKEQRDYAWQAINDIPGVSCVKPKGALYLFPKLDRRVYPIENDEQLVLELLQSKHLLLVQGTAFNWPEPDHLRMVFLSRIEDLKDSLDKLASFLDKYQK